MKNQKKNLGKDLGLLILLLAFVQGCVSASKHKKLEENMTEAGSQIEELKTSYSDQVIIINQLKSKLGDANADVGVMKKALKEAALRKAETEKRVKEYSDLLKKFKTLIDAGRLQVKILRGRMVVQMDSDILFGSGSSNLSKDGISAIKDVAKVFASIEGKDFQIEGHTDNVPIKTARFPSNWELASARAMTVLKAMMESGMSGERISIASFGENKPVTKNETNEEKAANRRIEVVVVPDLSQLPGFEELNQLEKTKEVTPESTTSTKK